MPIKQQRNRRLQQLTYGLGVLVLAAMLVTTGCGSASSQTSESDREAIQHLLTVEYIEAINSGDATAYAHLFTQDAMWSPPDAPIASGRAGVEEGVQHFLDLFAFDVSRNVDDLQVVGDGWAYAVGHTEGTLTPREGGDAVPVQFTVMFVLEEQDGAWKIHRQMWNNKPSS